MKKAAKIIGIIAGVVIVIVIIAIVSSPSEETLPFSEQIVTVENVQEALNINGTSVELGDCITDIQVLRHAGTDNPDDFIVHVYFKPESIWDEEDAVQTAVQSSIKAMETLFQNQTVGEVVMWEQLEFTDQYGSAETETAIRILMTKETADKVADWGVVADRAWSDYNNFFDLAELQYVHPAIAGEL